MYYTAMKEIITEPTDDPQSPEEIKKAQKYFDDVLKKKHGLSRNPPTEAQRAAKEGVSVVSLGTAATEAYVREGRRFLKEDVRIRFKKLPKKLREGIREDLRKLRKAGMTYPPIVDRLKVLMDQSQQLADLPDAETPSVEPGSRKEIPDPADDLLNELDELDKEDGDPTKSETIH